MVLLTYIWLESMTLKRPRITLQHIYTCIKSKQTINVCLHYTQFVNIWASKGKNKYNEKYVIEEWAFSNLVSLSLTCDTQLASSPPPPPTVREFQGEIENKILKNFWKMLNCSINVRAGQILWLFWVSSENFPLCNFSFSPKKLS